MKKDTNHSILPPLSYSWDGLFLITQSDSVNPVQSKLNTEQFQLSNFGFVWYSNSSLIINNYNKLINTN